MKKSALWMTGIMAVMLLAACSPTQTETKTNTVETTEKATTAPVVKETETIIHDDVVGPGAVEYIVPDDRNTVNASTEAPAEVILYYGLNEDVTGLVQRMEEVQEMTPQIIMNYMAEDGSLDPIQVNSFDVNDGVGKLDISAEPAGVDDDLAPVALGNSFIDNYELDSLEVYVNGKPLYTGADALQFNGDYKKLK